MKKLITSVLMVAGVSAALAQGSITFNTSGNANTALGRTFLADGTSAPGAAYLGQLWWSDTSNGTYAQFSTVGGPQAFSIATPNFVQDGTPSELSRIPGSTVFIQMRVWNSSAGATWAAAGGDTPGSNALLQQYGISQAKSRVLAGIDSDSNIFSPSQYNNFLNLTLTAVGVVPEPSTIALAGLGVASLLLFRRRK